MAQHVVGRLASAEQLLRLFQVALVHQPACLGQVALGVAGAHQPQRADVVAPAPAAPAAEPAAWQAPVFTPAAAGPADATLAPLYDLLCTAVYPRLTDKMAMKLGGQYRFSALMVRHWERFARDAGLSPAQVKKRVMAIASRLHHENLVGAMFSGRKAATPADGIRSAWRDEAAFRQEMLLVLLGPRLGIWTTMVTNTVSDWPVTWKFS